MQRRLAAIMVADVVGYSAMMEKAEERTAEWLLKCEAIVSERVTSLSGRIFNTAGDATLAEFGSAINALRCAAEIRSALAGANNSEMEPPAMRFGLHLAESCGPWKQFHWRRREYCGAHPAGRRAR